MNFNELVSSFTKQYLGEDVLSSLTSEVPTYLDSSGPGISALAPLIVTPIASPFMRKKRQSGFPMPSSFKKYSTTPREQRGVTGDYEDQGQDEPEAIELEDIPEDLRGYLTNVPSGKVNIFGKNYQAGPVVQKGIFGTNFAKGPGKILGRFTGMTGLLGSMAGTFGQKNLEQLEYITAMAGLGKTGYGVGLVNGQVVGVTPDYVVGTLPTSLTQDQRNKITDQFTGKSGRAGSGVKEMQKSFADTYTPTPESKAYEKTIMNSTLSSDLKNQMLGFNPSFRGGGFSYEQTIPTNYKQTVSGSQYIKDTQSTEQFRNSMTFTPSNNFGLETDIVAQNQSTDPQGKINVGINMDNITNTPITPASLGPTYMDTTVTEDSSNQGIDDGGSQEDSSSMGDSGFGGGGGYSTAYGGRIEKAYGGGKNKGFASKTPDKITIQGVGLIKPNETFLKTDTVRDRYDLEARENDFIINGPTSEQFKKPILAFINQAETNLKNKGVDISVGKPTIPKGKQVPLLVASSENYIPKEYIEAFNPNDPEEGYRILEAMNNVGKPEVTRLKKELGEPTDKSKYQANRGMRVGDPRQGFLSGTPKLNLTGPNIDKYENADVPGISDQPIEMSVQDELFFNDFPFKKIKEAIKKTEIRGFEENPFIFTGVKKKYDKVKKRFVSSSAFGPMQITASLLNDFKDRSPAYKALSKEEKKYIAALALQGEDKINYELYGTLKRGPKDRRVNLSATKFYGKKEAGLLPYGKGVVSPELHKKYYEGISDKILRHKLKDHKTIEKALGSYGEGGNYSQKVLNDLLDSIQLTE